MKGATSLLAATILVCSCTPEDPTQDGVGGGGGNGGSNFVEISPGTEVICDQTRSTISAVVCDFNSAGEFRVYGIDADGLGVLTLRIPEPRQGSFETEYSGTQYDGGPAAAPSVAAVTYPCRASTLYSPSEQCFYTVERLVRGTSTGAAGSSAESVEEGSSVRIRVQCPDSLYTPGGDDFGPTSRSISPTEFLFEAANCKDIL